MARGGLIDPRRTGRTCRLLLCSRAHADRRVPFVGKDDLATRLRTAIEETLQVDNVQIADLSGKVTTADFASAVIKRLAA
jgi:hypothetical protein